MVVERCLLFVTNQQAILGPFCGRQIVLRYGQFFFVPISREEAATKLSGYEFFLEGH